jgi:uncharacterized protein (TIGR03435 family)
MKLILLLCVACSIQAQTFEVASVRPATGGYNGFSGGCRGIDSRGSSSVPLGRCVISDARLSHMIGIAWDVSMLNLKTRPDWVQRGMERFNVNAKAENPRTTTDEDLHKMLRALLIERFKLKYHLEDRTESGYALMVSKKGPKLQRSTAEHPGIDGGKPTKGRPIVLSLRKVSMAQLAEILSGYGSGPTIDKTGLTGEYDIKLNWDDNAGPSIYSALQDQLGLRLQPQKVISSLFVVDSAQKPEPE